MAEKYNIVYYMGAGASAMGIPVVADFKKVPKNLYEFINARNESSLSSLSYPLEKEETDLGKINAIIKKFMNDFEMVSSMDTLALRLYQHYKEGNKYKEYKLFLQFIFCFQHFYKVDKSINYGDPRYENLIRTIGEANDSSQTERCLKVEMPNNFKFITWNYDILFENTLLTDSITDKSNQKIIDLFLKNEENNNTYNGATLLKVNGTAFASGINYSIFSKRNIDYDDFKKHENLFFETLLEIYRNSARDNPKIEFAWENDNNNKIISSLKNIACLRNIIVVIIGYSFPSVNRIIDKAFFENLPRTQSGQKTKIYIQGRDYADSVRTERLFNQCYFKNKNRLETIPVESGEFFFIPSEHFEYVEVKKPRGIRVVN